MASTAAQRDKEQQISDPLRTIAEKVGEAVFDEDERNETVKAVAFAALNETQAAQSKEEKKDDMTTPAATTHHHSMPLPSAHPPIQHYHSSTTTATDPRLHAQYWHQYQHYLYMMAYHRSAWQPRPDLVDYLTRVIELSASTAIKYDDKKTALALIKHYRLPIPVLLKLHEDAIHQFVRAPDHPTYDIVFEKLGLSSNPFSAAQKILRDIRNEYRVFAQEQEQRRLAAVQAEKEQRALSLFGTSVAARDPKANTGHTQRR